jgi:hypothetical protein
VFKDGIRGDALDAIMTCLSVNIPELGGPGVRWCYGSARDPQGLDEGFTHNPLQLQLALNLVQWSQGIMRLRTHPFSVDALEVVLNVKPRPIEPG